MIYIKSPGPIFFAQERVGKNGKMFKMYKFPYDVSGCGRTEEGTDGAEPCL